MLNHSKKMYPIDKGLPFYSSLLLLGVLRFYPLNTNNYKEKYFIWILYLWVAIWGGNILNIGIRFFSNLSGGNFDEFSEDLAFLVGHCGCMLCGLSFGLQHRNWSDLFEAIATYGEFGKPPKHNKMKKYGDMKAVLVGTYITVSMFAYILLLLMDEDKCEKIYEGRRICGTMNPTWWPSQIEQKLLFKRLLLVYQIASSFTLSGFIVVINLNSEVVEFISARADHLAIIFNEICFIEDGEEQFKIFKLWIRYHQNTIRLCEKLNDVSKRTIGHVYLIVAVVLACLLDQATKDTSRKSVPYMCSYVGTVFLLCHAGQRMESKMMSIGDSLYSSEWCQCEIKIKKLIPLIIQRSQRRIGLDALPIGKLNYLLFLMILKTTYSYFTLLNNI